MMGATVKNHFAEWAGIPKEDLFVVSIVPCLAKKSEAARDEFAPGGIRDVDCVLTSTELIEMVSIAYIDAGEVKPAEFDDPYRQVSGAGILFGASGGVAEAALRMAVEKLTGEALTEHLEFETIRGFEGLKEATVKTGDKKVRVAVISGLHNAEPIIDRIHEGVDVSYDLIEVMACPGGCICGAGHPVPEKVDSLEKRQQVLVNIDKISRYRKSQENPDIIRLYEEYYGEANSDKAHKLLHTHFVSRKGGTRSSRTMGDSVFKTRSIEVCICEKCKAKGAIEFCVSLGKTLPALKLAQGWRIMPLHLNVNHPGEGLYIVVDGIQVSELELKKFLKLARPADMEPFAHEA
jgi:formate dehydrogenase major subunit